MDSNSNLIYFENNRSTVPDPRVTEIMRQYREKQPTMAGTNGPIGQALEQVAGLINSGSDEVAFTKGTSESIEIGIELLYHSVKHKGHHIITSPTEHAVVLNSCARLEKEGATISYLGVDREGLPDLSELRGTIRPETIMVCLMAANNETGVLWPVEKIAEICREKEVLFFCDASQFVGKELCDAQELGIDCLAFGSHKMYGPKGIGALYVNKQAMEKNHHLAEEFAKLKTAVNQDMTEAALGFGKACEIAKNDYWDISSHISKLRNYFEHQLLDIEGLRINGSTRYRIHSTSNLTFSDAQKLLPLKTKYEFSSNVKRFSHVLDAMGISKEDNHNSFRFSFGKYNTVAEVKQIVEDILRVQSC